MCAPSVDLRRRMEEDIYLGIFFNTCLLGFLHFCNCTSSIDRRIHDIRPPPPRARRREQGRTPRGPAAVSSPEQDTSRDLLHGTKRTVSSRAECTGILLVRLVVLRRAELLTPAGAADADARVSSYTTQASRLTVLAQHASFNPPFPATSPHETERSSSLVGDGVYMED